MTRTVLIIAAAWMLTGLQGCAVVSVASTAVGTVASVAGTVVTTTVDVGAAAVHAALPSDDSKKKD